MFHPFRVGIDICFHLIYNYTKLKKCVYYLLSFCCRNAGCEEKTALIRERINAVFYFLRVFSFLGTGLHRRERAETFPLYSAV